MVDKLSDKDEKKLLKIFKKNTTDAKKIVKEPNKIAEILKNAINKANDFRGPLDKVWDKLQLFFNLIQDYIKGTYREIPLGSIIAIIAALTYLISPIDIIPDFLTGIGLIDDIYIINIALKQVSADLQKYKDWKLQQVDILEVVEI